MISPLTRRVLMVNMLALGALVAGLLFLDQYEDGLVEAELASLHTQAEIFAGALGESAAGPVDGGGRALLPAIARPMLRRLVGPPRAGARRFGGDGAWPHPIRGRFRGARGGRRQSRPFEGDRHRPCELEGRFELGWGLCRG